MFLAVCKKTYILGVSAHIFIRLQSIFTVPLLKAKELAIWIPDASYLKWVHLCFLLFKRHLCLLVTLLTTAWGKKTDKICPCHWERPFSVIISQYNEDKSQSFLSMPCLHTGLLSLLFTAFVSIEFSMSQVCYHLWRFFFHRPKLETHFQLVFIMPFCKPNTRGNTILNHINSHQ